MSVVAQSVHMEGAEAGRLEVRGRGGRREGVEKTPDWEPAEGRFMPFQCLAP